MLIYIEFISRRPGVSLEHFHSIAGELQAGWAADYSDDQLLLKLGRTWRIGPEPEYLAIWFNREAGLERLDEWERVFRSGEIAAIEDPMEIAARLDTAGCYEPLVDPVQGVSGPYYAEFFDFADGASRQEVVDSYSQRRKAHDDLELHLLCDRIGHLGREPRGLAIWGLESYADLESIARDLDEVPEPVRLVDTALYANLGDEIL
jgi:hypothetical protein